MNHVLTLLVFCFFSNNVLHAQRARTQIILFAKSNHELNEKNKKYLKKIATLQDSVDKIRIIGYTDIDGNNNYNLNLSKKRAKAVEDYLLFLGFSGEKIVMECKGESQSKSIEESYKRYDRKVEIKVLYKDKKILSFLDVQKKPSQFITVNASKSIKVQGNEGTQITIKAKSFEKYDRSEAEGNIILELKEFYKKSDIILNNLYTSSNNKMLLSGGMIYLSANQNGKPLRLKEGSHLEICFAKKEMGDSMSIFTGKELKGEVEWIKQKELSGKLALRYNPFDTSLNNVKYDNQNLKKELVEIDNIILNSYSLGWVNCDKFYEYNDLGKIFVIADKKFNSVFRLVFKDLNSVLPATVEEKPAFNGIPIGKQATLLAFSNVDGVPMFAIKEITIKDKMEVDLVLKPSSLKDIEISLEGLD